VKAHWVWVERRVRRLVDEEHEDPGVALLGHASERAADAKAGVEPYGSYLKLGEEADIPVSRFVRCPRPGAASGSMFGIEVIVLGGETNTYWFGGDFSYVTSASVDRWR
jgi:hypothetical protein